jgi:transcriptional regulator with XRE-family HTH domain
VRTRKQATPYLRAFGAAVRSRREALTLSQEELCFRSDLDRTYISGIERGVRNPTLKTMLRLADALKVKLDDLIGSTQRIADSGR